MVVLDSYKVKGSHVGNCIMVKPFKVSYNDDNYLVVKFYQDLSKLNPMTNIRPFLSSIKIRNEF